MITPQYKDLLKAGVHLGHLSKKWNPNMSSFIFMERHGIHIIDLNKTLAQLQEATQVLQTLARAGKKILFVATKKQAKELVEQEAKRLEMPYMTERWLGGTLTNFVTIRKLIKKLNSMERMTKSDAYKNMAKKEQLMLVRDKAKLERVLKGILDLTKPPSALVVVDITKEHIAVQEATKLGIPVIALTDTNSNPNLVDYPIPSNDDSNPSISLLIKAIGSSIEKGLSMREQDKELEAVTKQEEIHKPSLRPIKAEKIASTATYSNNSGSEATVKVANFVKPLQPNTFKNHNNQKNQGSTQDLAIQAQKEKSARPRLEKNQASSVQAAVEGSTMNPEVSSHMHHVEVPTSNLDASKTHPEGDQTQKAQEKV